MRHCKGLLEVDEGVEIERIVVSFEAFGGFLGERHVDALRDRGEETKREFLILPASFPLAGVNDNEWINDRQLDDCND